MPRLSELRALLGLPPAETGHADDRAVDSPEHACALLPGLAAPTVRQAALRLLAREAATAASASLLQALLDTLRSPRPERDLTRLLADLTAGRATLHASWGDLVAEAGPGGDGSGGDREHFHSALTFEGRAVGSLTLVAAPEWAGLFALASGVALTARLQAAAAGAARRRQGERALEALLAGDAGGAPELGEVVVAALRLAAPLPRSERARATHLQLLDTLCTVGEGYFRERGLSSLSTVRGDRALWLWPTHDAPHEAAGLLVALGAGTAARLRLGVSAVQVGCRSAPLALEQAQQALAEVTHPGEAAHYTRPDPLRTLLASEAAGQLATSLLIRLRQGDPGGRLEDTLRRYLGHRGGLGELAAAMHLHVNTLRHRLHRAEDLLGGELAEPAFLARLYLALEVSGAGGE